MKIIRLKVEHLLTEYECLEDVGAWKIYLGAYYVIWAVKRCGVLNQAVMVHGKRRFEVWRYSAVANTYMSSL